jgi:hypothetical protein
MKYLGIIILLVFLSSCDRSFQNWKSSKRTIIEEPVVYSGDKTKITVRFTALENQDFLGEARLCGKLYQAQGHDGVWCYVYDNPQALDGDVYGDLGGGCWKARWQQALVGEPQEEIVNSETLSLVGCPRP